MTLIRGIGEGNVNVYSLTIREQQIARPALGRSRLAAQVAARLRDERR